MLSTPRESPWKANVTTPKYNTFDFRPALEKLLDKVLSMF